MIRVGILNVTGYAGSELVRILWNHHPDVEIRSVTGRSAAGQSLSKALPHLREIDLEITSSIEDSVDLVFSALPSGASANAIAPLLENGTRVVDIAADFRIHDAKEFKNSYKIDHPAEHLLARAVYGLPEIHRNDINGATLVANPGCYPTAAILALAPVVGRGIVLDDIIVDAKSGISGAGRGGLSQNALDHFAEASENVVVYGLEGHAHRSEIAQELSELQGRKSLTITFIPHRVPMIRGIMATCYARLSDEKLSNEDVRDIYRDFYVDEPFVRVTEDPPQTKQTSGSNMCLVYPTIDTSSGRLVVVSCLDNLVKGAAGQAVQNMNGMLGLPEIMGLETLALYP